MPCRYGKCGKCGVGEGYGKHDAKAAAYPGGKVRSMCSDGGRLALPDTASLAPLTPPLIMLSVPLSCFR